MRKPEVNMRPCARVVAAMSLSALSLLLAGCSLSQFSAPSSASSALPQISGKVHGGQQPVSGATIQLYAASVTAIKGASTALIGSTVMTDANGNFNITGDYTCPTANALVYLVAIGGNPGLPGTVNNGALALMAVLGTCGSLSSSTFISINEITTVASVEALASFMADVSHVGSDPVNTGGLAGAFASATAMVNFSTGQPQPASTGVMLPTVLLNTLADILSACVNTTGTTTTGTSCGNLLQYAGNGNATDTIGAMLGIVQSPAQNVAQLFALVNAQSPFSPTLPNAPQNFILPITINLPSDSGANAVMLAIDTAQHIWVYTQDQSANPANLAYLTGPITVYDNNGTLLFTIQPGTGGLYFPLRLAADPFGNVWALNDNFTLSKFDTNGNPLSPAAGFPIPGNLAGVLYQNGNLTYAPGLDFMSFDPSGNLWGIGPGTSSNCFIEVNNTGSAITPNGNFCSGAGNSGTFFAATDGSGNAWFLGDKTVSKVSNTGALLHSGVNTNGCFSINTANIATAENSTESLLYDRAHDQLWGVADIGIGALRADGSQVFCNGNGANLPLFPNVNVDSSGTGTIGFLIVASAAVDGAGNLWFTSTGSATNFVNHTLVSRAVYNELNELDSTGQLVTPYNANAGIYGLDVGQRVEFLNGNIAEALAVDGYGNIWMVTDFHQLLKIPGLAVPKNYQ